MKRNLKWISMVMAAAMLLSVSAPAVSAGSSSLSDVNDKISQAQDDLQKGKEKQNALVKQIDEVNAKIQDTEEEIGDLDQKMETQQEKVQEAQQELSEKKSDMREQNDALGKRLRVMYKSGDTGMLEVLLGSADISELISNIDMIQLIYQNDENVLDSMEDQYDEISLKKEKLEKLKNELEDQQKQKKESQNRLNQEKAELEALEAKVAKDNEALEAQIDELNKEASRITEEMQKGELAASSSADSSYEGGTMLWPVPTSHRITSRYGNRFHPILHVNKFHSGLDIGAPSGDPILAAADGKVIFAGVKGGYGNCVMIDHGGGVVTLYGHSSKLLVSQGEQVSRGQNIALVGSTGQSTGPHCHFEVRINGSTTDPTNYLDQTAG